MVAAGGQFVVPAMQTEGGVELAVKVWPSISVMVATCGLVAPVRRAKVMSMKRSGRGSPLRSISKR